MSHGMDVMAYVIECELILPNFVANAPFTLGDRKGLTPLVRPFCFTPRTPYESCLCIDAGF
eukprot:2862202-Pleurochrysis_carterae.AAC.1